MTIWGNENVLIPEAEGAVGASVASGAFNVLLAGASPLVVALCEKNGTPIKSFGRRNASFGSKGCVIPCADHAT